MQKSLLVLTIGCGVLWSLTGIMTLATGYMTGSKTHTRGGWVYLAVGIGWGLTVLWPESWNWGIPTLLICATAWNWWDRIGSSSAVKDKAD
jgi:hypothetical protein